MQSQCAHWAMKEQMEPKDGSCAQGRSRQHRPWQRRAVGTAGHEGEQLRLCRTSTDTAGLSRAGVLLTWNHQL